MREARPGRLLSLAIEASRDELIDLDVDPGWTLAQRALIQITARLALSRASEVPEMLRPFLPMLLGRDAVPTSDGSDLSDAEAAQLMFGAEGRIPLIFTVEREVPYGFAVLIRTDWLVAGVTVDDLEDELTVFGIVEKVLPEGKAIPLERYVLPGLSRTLRRAAGNLRELLDELPGEPLQDDDLEFQGPGAVVRGIAIFP